jgi:acyl-CoA thioester hydrolase
MPKPEQAETRSRYQVFQPITTRWSDNDIYGHINNAVYHLFIDTTVTRYFMRHGLADVRTAPIIAVAAETGCTFRRPLTHPVEIEAGLRVDRIGTSSVRSGVGIFRKGEDEAAAWGHIVHVFVDRTSNRAVPIPPHIRHALEQIAV